MSARRDDPFSRELRHAALAWIALLALLATTVALARLHLGPWNLVASLGIAWAKTVVVVLVFMGLARTGRLPPLAAAAGCLGLVLMGVLGSADRAVRVMEGVPWQRPQKVAPVLRQQHATQPAAVGAPAEAPPVGARSSGASGPAVAEVRRPA